LSCAKTFVGRRRLGASSPPSQFFFSVLTSWQGYEDEEDDASDDEEEDGSYADEEYGHKKHSTIKKKKTKREPSSTSASIPRPKGTVLASLLCYLPLYLDPPAIPTHASDSDSDSEYGSRSKKKKKSRGVSGEEIRISSRGGKVPNYVDDVQDSFQFEDDDETETGYYVDPNVKEEDEIEVVLSHSRDEGREDDPEDLWFDNVVSLNSSTPHAK